MSYQDVEINEEEIANAMAKFRGEQIDPGNGNIADAIAAGMADPNDQAVTGGQPQQQPGQQSRLIPQRPFSATGDTEQLSADQLQALTEQQRIAEQQAQQQQPTEYDIDGRKIPAEVLRSMVSFDDFLKANPMAAQRLRDALNPQQQQQQQVIQPPPPPVQQPIQQQQQQPTPEFQLPPDFDIEEPANKFIVDSLTKISQDNSALRQLIESQQQQTIQERASRDMTLGINRFSNKYESVLTPDDISAIRDAGVAIYPSMVQKNGGAIEQATVETLEYAMWTVPTVRQKLLGAQEAQSQVEAEAAKVRQRQLTALAGGRGSGNAPTIQAPSTPREGRMAMVRAIREGMTTDGQQTA